MIKLKAKCAMCDETKQTEVSPSDWIRYTSGALAQVVWPDESPETREIIIANRPGNLFGAVGFWCEHCDSQFI